MSAREIERIRALADATVSPRAADALEEIADRMERALGRTCVRVAYITTHEDREREERARASSACPVCGAPKEIGAVVCWAACWHELKASPFPAGVWLAQRGVK